MGQVQKVAELNMETKVLFLQQCISQEASFLYPQNYIAELCAEK